MFKAIVAGIFAIPLALLIAVVVSAIVSAIVAWPVQHLYNFLATGELWDMSFKQAWALTLLVRLLVGK